MTTNIPTKIIEYRVIETSGARGSELLAHQVNAFLTLGWEPIGGVSVMVSPIIQVYVYHQAIVKREDDRPTEAKILPRTAPRGIGNLDFT